MRGLTPVLRIFGSYPLTGGEPEPFLSSPFDEKDAAFSPDGLWLAYISDESGRHEVYIRSVEGSGRWQISDAHAHQPMWAPNGGELFFRTDEGLMAIDIEVEGEKLRAGRPSLLFGEMFGSLVGVQVPGYLFYDYDVGVDGERFVVFPRRTEVEEGQEMHLVTGWFEELRSLIESAGG